MPRMKIANGTWILVGDGRKAMVLRNDGLAEAPNFHCIATREQPNPPTRDQGTDAPGRAFASKGAMRSAVETTDWHDVEERRFAASLAAGPLKPGARIEIPNAPGKFDFLEVDPAAHRLLAGHEKDDTADFFDLTANKLIARVKVGPAVGVTVDPKTGNYFASVQDDKRIARSEEHTSELQSH